MKTKGEGCENDETNRKEKNDTLSISGVFSPDSVYLLTFAMRKVLWVVVGPGHERLVSLLESTIGHLLRVSSRVDKGTPMKATIFSFISSLLRAVMTRAETNTSSTRLPGSSKYPNYPIAGIRIR